MQMWVEQIWNSIVATKKAIASEERKAVLKAMVERYVVSVTKATVETESIPALDAWILCTC